MEKMGGTLHIAGPVYYGGSRDELNAKLRQRDDYIDILRAVLLSVDKDVRHHLRSDAIDSALIRAGTVKAVRTMLED